MLSSGATYAVALGGCQKPSEVRLLGSPRRSIATPQFLLAHAYLRDRQPLPSPSHTIKKSVVVIGSGMSGLSAAVTLEEAGVDVVVVESERRGGGAAVSEVLGGGLAPLGSVYFVDRTPELDRLIRRGAVEPVPCPPDGYDFGTGEVVQDLWTDATLNRVLVSESERDGMKRFRDFVLGLGDNLPAYPLPNDVPPDQQWMDTSAEEWVKTFRSQTLLTVLNAYSRSSMGALLARTNVYCLLNFYSGEFGESFDGGRYTFPHGPGALTQKVSASLKNLHASTLAVRVANVKSGVEVDCVDERGRVVRYQASHALIAAPKFQMPALVPEMPSVQMGACKELSYAPYMTLHIVSDVPLVQSNIYDTWNLTSEFETDVVNPCSVPGTSFRKSVASLFLPMDRFARGQLQDPDLFARRAADVADRFLLSRSQEQANSVREIYAWGWGHGLVVPTPGSHMGIAQVARTRIGNIHFANADNDAAPAIENAVFHGASVAQQLMEPNAG